MMLKLKFIIIYSLFILINMSILNAQAPITISELDKTTNPDDVIGNKFTLRPNFFKWYFKGTPPTHHNFNILSSNFPNSIIESPYTKVDNSVTSLLRDTKDFNMEDGWELIEENFGIDYDANGNILQSSAGIENPHFVIYNKYTGMISVFVAVGHLYSAYNSTAITLKFIPTDPNGFVTNMLTYATKTKPLIALDQIPPLDHQISSVSEFQNERGFWFYANFVSIYDPCTCLNKAKLGLKIEFISTAKIQFEMSTDGSLIDKEDGKIKPNSGKVALSTNDLVTGGKKASETYNTINSFVNNEQNAVNEYKTKIPSMNPIEADKAFNGLGILQKNMYSSKFLSDGLKMLPTIGSVFNLVDMFVTGGSRGVVPIARPLVLRATSTANGFLTSNDNYPSIQLGLPGGTNNQDFSLHEQPTYNNTLGVFNILNTPKINYYNYVNSTDPPDVTPNVEDPICYFDSHEVVKFKLDNDIRYVINPASKLKYQNASDVEIIGAIYYEFDKIPDSYYEELGIIIKIDDKSYRTRYLPLACLKDLTAQFKLLRKKTYKLGKGGWPNYNDCNGPMEQSPVSEQEPLKANITVDLIANLKRDDNEEIKQNVMYSGKYYSEMVAKIEPSYWNTNNYANILNNITLNSAITSNQNISAWEKVTIASGFSVTPGITVNIRAGEEIVVNQGINVPSNVSMILGSPIECTSVIQPLTTSELYTFCMGNNGGQYKSHDRVLTSIMKDDEINNSHTAKTGIEIKTELYDCKPNPANSSTSILYYAPKGSEINFDISNIFGEVVIRLENTIESFTGEHSKVIDTSKFPSGTYFVTMRSAEKIETKKLIIIK